MQAKAAIAIGEEEAKPPAGGKDMLPANLRRSERVMEICEAMIDVCAALYGVSSKEIRQTCKSTSDVVRVRQIAMYVMHVSLGVTMQEVGWAFARDRTTVRYACYVIEDLRDDDDFDRTVATTERVALAAFRNRLES